MALRTRGVKPASKSKRKARPAGKNGPARSRAGAGSSPPATVRVRAATLGSARRGPPPPPLARFVAGTADDRHALALLMLPFLLMATGVGISQSMRNFQGHGGVAAIHAPAAETGWREASLRRSIASLPRVDLAPAAMPLPLLPLVAAPPAGEFAALETPQPPELATHDGADGDSEAPARVCMAAAKLPAPTPSPDAAPADPAAFGLRLAAAARAQVGDFVIYNDKYRHISYPMGDVAPLFGVCSDLVVRAYRAVGLDLQSLVHLARVGSGDTSIDHRRTEVLRRYFSAYGETLPITQFAEDYLPGDIVTYYRPQNRHSRSHIAMVSDVIARSGRPMIIHNRGWGPQMEDALFVDQITGHYRYAGAKRPDGATREWAQSPPESSSQSAPTNGGYAAETGRPVQASFGGATLSSQPNGSAAGAGSAPSVGKPAGRF
jgi:uncharacterized protein YijF (DUF1287 family)